MRNLILSILFSLLTLLSNAQDTASVFWELSLNTTQNFLTNGAVIGENQSASDQYKIYDYGGTSLSQSAYAKGGGFGFWPNEMAENQSRYCEFKASPRNGVSFQLT
jgi:hypothetical protein